MIKAQLWLTEDSTDGEEDGEEEMEEVGARSFATIVESQDTFCATVII